MCDSDSDSLFGSPPTSPKRDRSPSLALPECSGWRMEEEIESQNVGTIALPGSHNHSELVAIKPALPSENNVPQLRPSGPRVQKRFIQATPLVGGKAPVVKNGILQLRPSGVPSEKTLHSDRTLGDLIGLVSNFESIARSSANPSAVSIPLTPASSTSAALGSAENPIEIEDNDPADSVNNALIALASTVTSAMKLPEVASTPPSNAIPTVNTVLYYIKNDPKLIPSLKATYQYLASIQSASDNLAKRQLEWGRQVLGELLGLFERGFAKARALSCTGPSREHSSEPVTKKQKLGHEDLHLLDEGVDSQRMVQWLSSVPSAVVEPTIVDSTNTDKLPSTSSYDDFLASFENVSGASEPVTTEDVAMYNLLFDGTTIEGFDLGLQPDSDFQPFVGSPQAPNIPHNCDPSLSRPDQFAGNVSFDANFDGENQAPRRHIDYESPLLFSRDLSSAERQDMTCLEESIDHTDDQSVGAQTFHTVPTESGASSRGAITPFQRIFSPSPSLDAPCTPATISPEKKAVTLAKAEVRRERLLQELEKVKTKQWELLIESDVLRTLKGITEYPP